MLKQRIFDKLKNAQNQVARLTPKWPNGKLSWKLGWNTNVINWFSLKNQKLIGGKNFGASLTEGGQNGLFGALLDQKMAGSKKCWLQIFPTFILLV